jgi:hypothetical protein
MKHVQELALQALLKFADNDEEREGILAAHPLLFNPVAPTLPNTKPRPRGATIAPQTRAG